MLYSRRHQFGVRWHDLRQGRARSCRKGLLYFLLAFVVSHVSAFSQPRERELAPRRTSPPFSPSVALSDLDGDGLADPATLNGTGLQNGIELHLSRTDEQMVLPFSAKAGGDGSLSVQDIDGDGDTDLLWREALPLPEVMVWLNDGVGRFECLCPPEPRTQEFALSGLGVHVSHRRRPDSALSSERNSPPGYALTPGWDFHVAVTLGSHRPEHLWTASSLERLSPNRSPPLLLC